MSFFSKRSTAYIFCLLVVAGTCIWGFGLFPDTSTPPAEPDTPEPVASPVLPAVPLPEPIPEQLSGHTFDRGTFGFTVHDDTVGWTILEDPESELDGSYVFYLHATATNLTQAPADYRGANRVTYGPAGTRIRAISRWFRESDITTLSGIVMQPGETIDAKVYTLYVGDGEYTIAFGNTRIPVYIELPSAQASAGSTVSASAQQVTPVLLESGWSAIPTWGGFYIQYGLRVHNPNENLAVRFPSVRITARSGSDAILATVEVSLFSNMHPNQVIAQGGTAFITDEIPAVVDFEVLRPGDWAFADPASLGISEYASLEVRNISSEGQRITGEVVNPGNYHIDIAVVNVIFRDDSGQITGGFLEFVNSLPGNSSTPFEINVWIEGLKTDNFGLTAHATA